SHDPTTYQQHAATDNQQDLESRLQVVATHVSPRRLPSARCRGSQTSSSADENYYTLVRLRCTPLIEVRVQHHVETLVVVGESLHADVTKPLDEPRGDLESGVRDADRCVRRG